MGGRRSRSASCARQSKAKDRRGEVRRLAERKVLAARTGPGGYNMFGPRAALELRAQETILSSDSYGTLTFCSQNNSHCHRVLLILLKSLNHRQSEVNTLKYLVVWMSGE